MRADGDRGTKRGPRARHPARRFLPLAIILAGTALALAFGLHRHLSFDQLLARRLEVFHPRIPVRTVNPRARKIRPYFPNYIFVRLDLEQVESSFLHWMPGSAGLVCFGAEPASVPDSLIAAIRMAGEAATHRAIHAA